MLKITKSFESALKIFEVEIEVVESCDKADKIFKNLFGSKNSKNKKSKILMYIIIRALGELIFLISSAKKTFNYLKQAFMKVLILQYFDSKYHIWIKTNALGYAIGQVLNWLTFNHLISNYLIFN